MHYMQIRTGVYVASEHGGKVLLLRVRNYTSATTVRVYDHVTTGTIHENEFREIKLVIYSLDDDLEAGTELGITLFLSIPSLAQPERYFYIFLDALGNAIPRQEQDD